LLAGALCDGSQLGWSSLCCAGQFVSCPSPNSDCTSASGMSNYRIETSYLSNF
jgi:hypothetical protein